MARSVAAVIPRIRDLCARLSPGGQACSSGEACSRGQAWSTADQVCPAVKRRQRPAPIRDQAWPAAPLWSRRVCVLGKERRSVLMGAALAKKRVRSAQEAPSLRAVPVPVGAGALVRRVRRCAVGRARRSRRTETLDPCAEAVLLSHLINVSSG